MFSLIKKELRPAIVSLLALTLITGLLYPVVVYGVAQAIFPHQANGSLIVKDGKPIGSEILGQPFDDPKYFWGRLSATSPKPFDASNSGGSNLGPTNSSLMDNVNGRIKALKDADPEAKTPVPVDLVTASASGLDPHISPAAAEYQVRRVAKARNADASKIRALVSENTEQRQLGVLGEARVNVLKLNLALDAQ